jgi:hypothetical protein
MRSFRTYLALSGAVTLAACGGDTGPQTVGGVAPPAGAPSASPTPTHSFVAPTDPKTYDGLGAVQHYEYHTDRDPTPDSPEDLLPARQGGQLYAGDATTVRDGGISLTYNPRDAIFELTINRPKGIVSVPALRFQDPVHRTDFAGAERPQVGVPNFATGAVRLAGIQYLDAGSETAEKKLPNAANQYNHGVDQYSSLGVSLFYQKPGTTTKYVTYAGFVRNTTNVSLQDPNLSSDPVLRETYGLDRAAFVFGERTAIGSVPTSGSGTYTGDMIASLVYNNQRDTDPNYPTYLQWMAGSQTTTVNFAGLTFQTTLDGAVLAPSFDAYSNHQYMLTEGTRFHASGGGQIDLVNRGGFTGQFHGADGRGACFATSCNAGNSLLVGGSSIDGAFFGPNGEEIGAGFRIVGGTPDQRIDIVGAFTGKK